MKAMRPSNATAREQSAALCEDGLLTVREAAEFLGLGRSTVYSLMASGALPYARLRVADRRIPRRALVAFAESQLIVGPSAVLPAASCSAKGARGAR